MTGKNTVDASAAVHQGRALQNVKLLPEVWCALDERDINSGACHAIMGITEGMAKKLGYSVRYIRSGNRTVPSDAKTVDLAVNAVWPELDDSDRENKIKRFCKSETDALLAYSKEHGAPAIIIHGEDFNEEVQQKMEQALGGSTYVSYGRPDYDVNGWGVTLHSVTKDKMAEAKKVVATENEWRKIAHPCVTVLLGNLGVAEGKELVEKLKTLFKNTKQENGEPITEATLLVTSSPRTRSESYDKLMDSITQAMIELMPGIKLHIKSHEYKEGSVKNPYLNMLAAADGIVVQGQSESMASEAAMSGAPIYYETKSFDTFIKKAEAVMGKEGASRYHRGAALEEGIPPKRWETFDSSDYYISKTVDNYREFAAREPLHSVMTQQEAHPRIASSNGEVGAGKAGGF